MYPELTTLILFGIAGAYIPGPNNIIASHSGFNFGFLKTIQKKLMWNNCSACHKKFRAPH